MNNVMNKTSASTPIQKAVSGQSESPRQHAESSMLKPSDTQVAISGKATMLSRLFNQSDGSSSPTFKTSGRDTPTAWSSSS